MVTSTASSSRSSVSLPFSMGRHMLFSHRPISPYSASQQREHDVPSTYPRDYHHYHRDHRHQLHHQQYYLRNHRRPQSMYRRSITSPSLCKTSGTGSSSSNTMDSAIDSEQASSSSSLPTLPVEQYDNQRQPLALPQISINNPHCHVVHASAAKTCEVCYSVDDDELLRHCPHCLSNVCLSCFRSWLDVRMQYGTAHKLTCLGCTHPVSDAELRAVCGDRALRRCIYLRQRFALRADSSAAWCPVDGCWALLPSPSDSLHSDSIGNSSTPNPSKSFRLTITNMSNNEKRKQKIMTCPDCCTKLCRTCGTVAHADRACLQPTMTVRGRAHTRIWQVLNTKKCPVCSVRIERAGGCAQMRCTSCQTKFCWRCRGVLVLFDHRFPPPPPPPPPTLLRSRFSHSARHHHYRRQYQLHAFQQQQLQGQQEADREHEHDEYGNGQPQHQQRPHQHQPNWSGRRIWRRATFYHGCICPRVHSTMSWLSFTGTVIVLAPFAITAAAVVTPPAFVVYVVLPRERKQDIRRRVITLLRRL